MIDLILSCSSVEKLFYLVVLELGKTVLITEFIDNIAKQHGGEHLYLRVLENETREGMICIMRWKNLVFWTKLVWCLVR